MVQNCSVKEARDRPNAILQAISFAAGRFLNSPDWEREIDAVLERLGRAAAASRAYVFENVRLADGVQCTSQRFEWVESGVTPQIGNQDLQMIPYEPAFARWRETFQARRYIYGVVEGFPTCEREFLDPQGIQSLVVMPIFAEQKWWGFIGFDDCLSMREWSPLELEALKTAADVIGSAIQRKRTEQALRWNEGLLGAMAAASPLGLAASDRTGREILYVNQRFREVLCLRCEAAPGQSALTVNWLKANCETMLRNPAAASCFQRLSPDDAALDDEIELVDGRMIRCISAPIRGASEAFGRLFVIEDITESKAAQRALQAAHEELESRVAERTAELTRANGLLEAEIAERQQSERSLREANEVIGAVLQAAPVSIWALDLEGRVLFWNPGAERMFGWSAEEVQGRRLPTISDEHSGDFEALLARYNIGEAVGGLERRRQKKDGSPIDIRLWTAPLRNAAGRVYGHIGVVVDITGQKLLEEQLRQAQKMEAIGRLAGGVAHDFNNIVTIITGYSRQLRAMVNSEQALHDIEVIQDAADRAASLTRQLLTFSRRAVEQPQALNLNRLVSSLQKMLHRLIGEDIELIAELSPGIGLIKADPGQIEQLIMNLAVNARDAMPRGGRLAIQTAAASAGKPDAAKANPGGYIRLTVRDTGCGMDAETQLRIFEPFFTTKEPGKGTGLGLSTVYAVVQQCGGYMSVESAPGQGARFDIYFPRTDEEECAPLQSSNSVEELEASGTILVVEDEEALRALVCQMLQLAGYTVLEAANAEDALSICRTHPERIDLLLTDVVMPRMDGVELAARAARMRQNLKILYTSGYPGDAWLDGRGVVDGSAVFLQKPFNQEKLADKVREALRR